MNDPIADMLTRIRNAQVVGKPEVILPYSKIKMSIAEFLSTNGWLGQVSKLEPIKPAKGKKSKQDVNSRFSQIKIEIKYNGKFPHIKSLQRVSKPGRRVYVGKDEIPTVCNGYGISVISTSRGLMSDKQARQEKVGGEVICELY